MKTKSVVIGTLGASLLLASSLAGLGMSRFFGTPVTYELPSKAVNASLFLEHPEVTTGLKALSVRASTVNTWSQYLDLKWRYGETLEQMKQEYTQPSSLDSNSAGRVMESTELVESLIAADIAAKREAKVKETHSTVYNVEITPRYDQTQPATDHFEPVDVIVNVNGNVPTVPELDALTKNKQQVEATVLREGKTLNVTSSLYGVRIKAMNVLPGNKKPQTDTEHFEGASAGGIVALEEYNRLKGDLIKGRKVAMTGTIGVERDIGPVGGVPAKTHLAVSEGIEILFVPVDCDEANNYSDAMKMKEALNSDMKVVPVKTLHQVIEYLERVK